MKRSRRNRRRAMSEINVVPYIDVMLVLLVIFMITAPLLSQGVRVNLPKASTKALPVEKKGPIIVSVNRQGQYFLNVAEKPGVPIQASLLVNRIAAELAVAVERHEERSVLVKGDKDVDYGKVVRIMVLLQNAGVSKVGLMTEDPERL